MITLYIDSSDNKRITVGLKLNNKKYFLKHKVDSRKAQIILPLIDKLFRKHNLKLEDIGRIEVKTGPGSFTGLSVGVSVANALGFFLKIPINGKRIGELAQPYYK